MPLNRQQTCRKKRRADRQSAGLPQAGENCRPDFRVEHASESRWMRGPHGARYSDRPLYLAAAAVTLLTSAIGIDLCAADGPAVALRPSSADPSRHGAVIPPGVPVIPPDVFAHIEVLPRRRGIAEDENTTYYTILAHARAMEPARLRAAAKHFQEQRRALVPQLVRSSEEPFPTFVDLFKHPQAYQGQPVTLEGHVHKTSRFPAGQNAVGLTELYEVWLYTEDSQTNPVVVVCTDVPKNFPIGEGLVDFVSVTGYFFRMYVYLDKEDNIRAAPLILAGGLEWHPERGAGAGPMPRIVYIIAGALVAVAALALLQSARSDRRFRERLLARARRTPAPDLFHLTIPAETPTSATAGHVPTSEASSETSPPSFPGPDAVESKQP